MTAGPDAGEPGLPGVAGRLPVTGEPSVDAAIGRLAELAGLPVSGHPAVFDDVHRQLTEALGDLDPPAGPGGPRAAPRPGDDRRPGGPLPGPGR